MIQFLQRTVLFLFIIGSVACQRAAENKTSLVISLPPSEKLNALSCSTCLKFLAVNISGDGISSTIYAKKEHGDFGELGTEISPEIELEVPVGKQRFFQLIAAYSNASDQIEIKYGTATADLAGSTNQVSMTLSSLGNFEGGHIAGRFLSGPDVGPTGIVNINIVPEAGRRSFTLFKTNIVNGWFDFFASKNFDVSYELEGGMPILSNIKLNEDFLPATLGGNSQIARIVRPASYDQYNGATWEPEDEDDTDLVIGYFFAPGYSDANKKICKQNTTFDLTRLSSDGGTTYLMYDPLGASGDVRVYGGLTTIQHADCGTAFNQQYNTNVIRLDAEQFNGMGNDTAKSLEGSFSYFLDNGQFKKYARVANTFTVHFLPNTLNNIYDGVKLFRATNEPSDRDNVACNPNFLSSNGFSEVPVASSTSAGTVLSITTTAAVSSGFGIICPTKSGELRGHGGMYLGLMTTPGSPAILAISDGPNYNYGTLAIGASVTHQFAISNIGGSNATGLGGTGLSAPFGFSGGAFPGTGGNCGTVLVPGGSCTVVVAFAPVSLGTFNDTFVIGYSDGTGNQSASRDIVGTGANPALLTISGNPNFGAIVVGNPEYIMYTVTNSGGVAATGISGIPLSAPFSFVGGSYPGAGGGTCGTTLASGASCMIRMVYLPSAYVTSNATIQIPYSDGNTGQTATLNITGQGT